MEDAATMKITPTHFKNGGEVDCCTRAKGRLSIRGLCCRVLDAAKEKFIDGVEYEAYCHEFTPGSRYSKDVVLKRGMLDEVVAYTNEKCGLEDTVETPSGDEAIPISEDPAPSDVSNTIYANEDMRSSMAEEPADKPEPIDAALAPKLTEAKLAEERMSRTWW